MASFTSSMVCSPAGSMICSVSVVPINLPVSRSSSRAGDWTLGVQNLANEQYINYVSQTVGDDDSYFAGRGRVVSLTWQQAF